MHLPVRTPASPPRAPPDAPILPRNHPRWPPGTPGAPQVRDVRFLDTDVVYWQTATQHYMVNGTSVPAPRASDVRALDGVR